MKRSRRKSREEILKEKMPTGVKGLDHLLSGGVNRNNSLLIEGPPGSGKSTFAIQMLYQGAKLFKEPGILVAFEEFPNQIYQEYADYGFDLAQMEKENLLRVIWTEPRKVLDGSTGKEDLIGRIIRDMGAKRLVIDSISHFKRVTNKESELREILHRILNNFKMQSVNAILVKEIDPGPGDSISFEEYAVDASIRLVNRLSGSTGENQRAIQIRKTRGQKHISGTHPFEFQRDGIQVFPHLRPVDIESLIPPKQTSARKIPTGVPGLDSLIGGGFEEASVNLVVGYSGTGKTTLARRFLHSHLAQGLKALHLSFQEIEERFHRAAESFGLDLKPYRENGQFDFMHLSPVGLTPEKLLQDLTLRILKNKYDCMVIDSISDLKTSISNQETLREMTHLLVMLFRRAGITTLALNESTEISGNISLSGLDFAYLADSVIQLSLAEIDGKVHRFLAIMKMANTDHSKDLHEFLITSQGMELRAKATGLSGILTGHTAGRFEAVADQVLEPLDQSTRALAEVLASNQLSEQDRKKVISAREKLGIADIVLKEHFGLTDLSAIVEEMERDN
ncbi:MAG: hypothetical protein KC917_10705 [Candidatus Omnitrophica bacterium]|nr:hypothetical protein [Candidatus Omnitrophota bacterium]